MQLLAAQPRGEVKLAELAKAEFKQFAKQGLAQLQFRQNSGFMLLTSSPKWHSSNVNRKWLYAGFSNVGFSKPPTRHLVNIAQHLNNLAEGSSRATPSPKACGITIASSESGQHTSAFSLSRNLRV